MKTLLTFIFTLSISTIFGTGIILAQAPEIEWQKSFGGTSSDIAQSIQQTTDGGYIIAGFSFSNDGDVSGNHGNEDYWVVKVNSIGNIEWQKSLGGSGDDKAMSVQQTNDGGYIVAGRTFSNNGDVTGNHGIYDYWIVKLNDVGVITWQQNLGGSGIDYASSIQQTTDNGYIIAGESNSINGDVTGNHGSTDYWIVKVTAAGDITWQKSLGGSGNDGATHIQQTSDGGYIVSGYSTSNDGDVTGNHGGGDYWILKLSSTGNIEWQKSLGGSGTDDARNVQQTVDGGYIVAGVSTSNDGDVTENQGAGDYWIVKLNNTGDIEWQKSVGGSSWDTAMGVQQSLEGGFLISGSSSSTDGDATGNHGSTDIWIVKLLDNGTLDWQKSLGGSDKEIGRSLTQTADGGYIIAGESDSIDGDVTGNHGVADFWIVKLFPDVLGVETLNNQIIVYPNPASSVLNIAANEPITSVSVFNQLGQQVTVSSHFDTTLQLNMSGLPSNMYFVIVNTANSRQTFKIIVR